MTTDNYTANDVNVGVPGTSRRDIMPSTQPAPSANPPRILRTSGFQSQPTPSTSRDDMTTRNGRANFPSSIISSSNARSMIPLAVPSGRPNRSRVEVAERPYEYDSSPPYVTTPSTQTSLIHSDEEMFQVEEGVDLNTTRTYDDNEIFKMELKLSEMKRNFEEKKRAEEKKRQEERRRKEIKKKEDEESQEIDASLLRRHQEACK